MIIKYCLLLVLLSYGLICSMLLFSRGFLLSRNVIPLKSVCEQSAVDSENVNGTLFCSSRGVKVILIVIDALRYDFISKFEGEPNKIYHDNFKFVRSLLEDRNNARLYKFVADAPTTTMQRLHGMMTGSLPTFIDVGSNFASSEIIEDNLLSQLKANNKNIVFLGDDTWTNLFPNYFYREYPYPSFDVWDLDTVDNGVNQNILSEIRRDDWDLLIAHYLGVDHCGHRYGPNHPEMKRKLLEMDSVIKNVIHTMDNKSILFVFGDHGMTENGDHGGDSIDEITAGIFVYSPLVLNDIDIPCNEINQIDLLPTLSTILGVPIPFSNLGSLVLEFLPKLYKEKQKLLMNNLDQITNYINVYNSKNNFFPKVLYDSIIYRYNELKAQTLNPSFNLEAKIYLKNVQDMCRSVWTQFDNTSINYGLICNAAILSLVLFLHFQSKNLQLLNVHSIILYFFIVSVVFFFKFFLVFSERDLYFYLFSIVSLVILILRSLVSCINVNFAFTNFESLFSNLFSIMIFLFSFIGQLSNSFIAKESHVMNYLLVTMVLYICFQINTYRSKHIFNLGNLSISLKFLSLSLAIFICICLRILSNFWQCYDDLSVECSRTKSSSLSFSVLTLITCLGFYCLTYFINLKFKLWSYNAIYLFLVMLSLFFFVSNSKSFNGFLFGYFNINVFPQIVCLVSLTILIIHFFFPFIFIKYKNIRNSYTFFPVYYSFSIFMWILSLVVLSETKIIFSVFMFVSLAFLITILGIAKVINKRKNMDLLNVSFFEVLVWYLSVFAHFYGTGHQPTLPSLQWDAVGPYTNLHIFIPGLLIIVNTFISHIVHMLLLPLLIIAPFLISDLCSFQSDLSLKQTFPLENDKVRREMFVSLFFLFVFIQGCRVFTIMLSAAIHSRHLMVWKIFAPKFIFESVGYIVSLVFLPISFIFVERISLFINMNSKNNIKDFSKAK